MKVKSPIKLNFVLHCCHFHSSREIVDPNMFCPWGASSAENLLAHLKLFKKQIIKWISQHSNSITHCRSQFIEENNHHEVPTFGTSPLPCFTWKGLLIEVMSKPFWVKHVKGKVPGAGTSWWLLASHESWLIEAIRVKMNFFLFVQ